MIRKTTSVIFTSLLISACTKPQGDYLVHAPSPSSVNPEYESKELRGIKAFDLHTLELRYTAKIEQVENKLKDLENQEYYADRMHSMDRLAER